MTSEPTTLDIPKNPAARRAWICYRLRLRGDSLRQIARRLGVTPQAVSAALMASSSHIEIAIAEAIGLTAQELFWERFDGQGQRLSHTRQPQRTTLPCDRNIQDGAVA